MSEGDGKRKYDSLRRTTQAMATRAEIAEAARRLFVSQGWAATTVRDVAREAGVSVPTVYAAYGNKAGLTRALADAADLEAAPAQVLAELEAADGDPAAQLAAMTAYDRRLFERSGDVIGLVREAGRTEPGLATVYLEARRRADGFHADVFSGWPDGTLRTGLDVPAAVDVYAAICNIDVYATLTQERTWRPTQIERWWTQLLTRELLAARSGPRR